MEYTEKRFEQDIEESMLTNGGYIKGDKSSYSAERGIDLSKLVEFIKTTQEKEWDRYVRIYGDEAENNLFKRFNDSVNAQGLLYSLRKGIADRGVKLKLCYFKPESNLNHELVKKYENNILTVTRQFAYSTENKNTIDMVLSLNGIPIVALELKNQITGQSIENGKKQFMYDRNPREPCFQFNKRFLAYFAVDLHEVAMTTKLAGPNTMFLPFNQGSGGAGQVGGAGNPENKDGYATSYLWEQVLTKDSLMNIIHRFLHINVEKKKVVKNGRETTKISQKLIFPRYHQLDVVTKLVNNVKQHGSGCNYLIQHSAGSGKSNSIAWIAYRLASLHDEDNNSIFNSVIVVTDRKVLDSQLQDTISGFDHTYGLVETIGDKKTSQDLKNAINDGKKIIVTTLQKFPVIYEDVENNKGKRFAVIVDEAHSSQTGTSAQKLKIALADNKDALEEYAKIEGEAEEASEDFEDKLVSELSTHGRHQNLSFFAFTATPKQKTLEMFGNRCTDGSFHPFHIYSMKQAIEEGFILDVLKNYMTYKTCFKIAKNIPDNPELPESEAKRAIRRYESLHPYNLQQKTSVMVEYFREITSKKINGQAKAMIITPSRLHAVRYYKEFKKYIKNKGYNDLDVLIAFSGTVKDGDEEYTESGMNVTKSGNKISEKQLPQVFHGDEFNMLIVAEKYQTGFDEPLLHTMFVDKKLNGVKAVQTLSRLNRTAPYKNDTFILDFVNNSEDILLSFAPYYKETALDEEINVNLIYDTKALLRNFRIYNDDDVEKSTKIYYKSGAQSNTAHGKITSMFLPIIRVYSEISEEDQFKFKKAVRNFIKWYSYITQIERMFDKDLQKEYRFLQYLEKMLPKNSAEKIDLEDKIKLEYYKLSKTFEGDISLETKDDCAMLTNPKTIDNVIGVTGNDELLDAIISKINEVYEGEFSDGDKVMVKTIYGKLLNDSEKLEQYTKDSFEIFNDSFFPELFDKATRSCFLEQSNSFKKIFENRTFYNTIQQEMARQVYRNYRNR
ncbi:type III restriction enzyme, res subunit [Methanococcus maripaludis C5]|uniref:Type III restriction enzyme, res subunit n=1 Tax=Methanococcus maripaludis (strain C5 / ATCC BAA-1333) TaxID=402880 RepID=A4FXL7_METM5|nr:DEAD/DEAH box helicase family protein [Methanococcus maripaludis]ABO34951.1 type III restriction enzyme, res subunit [Methanococcus maripaludis C5]